MQGLPPDAPGGVGIAGDSFDSRIVEHCVTPHLGRGTRYRSMDGQMLPMPVWPFEYMRRWHLLSFLNTTQTRRMPVTGRCATVW